MYFTKLWKNFVSRLIFVSATSPVVLCMYNLVFKSIIIIIININNIIIVIIFVMMMMMMMMMTTMLLFAGYVSD